MLEICANNEHHIKIDCLSIEVTNKFGRDGNTFCTPFLWKGVYAGCHEMYDYVLQINSWT